MLKNVTHLCVNFFFFWGKNETRGCHFDSWSEEFLWKYSWRLPGTGPGIKIFQGRKESIKHDLGDTVISIKHPTNHYSRVYSYASGTISFLLFIFVFFFFQNGTPLKSGKYTREPFLLLDVVKGLAIPFWSFRCFYDFLCVILYEVKVRCFSSWILEW